MKLAQYLCSQKDMPICQSLQIEQTTLNAFDSSFLGFHIRSPYLCAILIITILCAFRMINHADSLYSSIGREEMKSVFTFYILSNLFLLFGLCLSKAFQGNISIFINIVQITCSSCTIFALFASSLTIDKIYGIMGFRSYVYMRILCAIYFFIIFLFSYIFVIFKVQDLVCVLLCIDIVPICLYIVVHVSKLRNKREEIWGIGVLLVIFVFFAMSVVHSIAGAKLVADLSERNIDNQFLSTSYMFLVMMMSHKYWLSTYDYEKECLALIT